MGNKVSLEDEMVNLRIVSKQMQRSSKKCEKNEKAALEKLKKVRLFAVGTSRLAISYPFLLISIVTSRPFNKGITKALESMAKTQ